MQILAMTGFACGAAVPAALSCATAWLALIARPKAMTIAQPVFRSRLCNMFFSFREVTFFNHFDIFAFFGRGNAVRTINIIIVALDLVNINFRFCGGRVVSVY
jgi:hypothetical protein